MGLIEFVSALRRPAEYLEVTQMERGNIHLGNRRKIYQKYMEQAIELAKMGHSVTLTCDEREIIKFSSTPTPGKASLNGRLLELRK